MRRIAVSVAFAAASFAACRNTPVETPPWNGGSSACCPVCVCEGDLACIDVAVSERTPRAQFRGGTYCFCSEACRERFVKEPAAYVHRAP